MWKITITSFGLFIVNHKAQPPGIKHRSFKKVENAIKEAEKYLKNNINIFNNIDFSNEKTYEILNYYYFLTNKYYSCGLFIPIDAEKFELEYNFHRSMQNSCICYNNFDPLSFSLI